MLCPRHHRFEVVVGSGLSRSRDKTAKMPKFPFGHKHSTGAIGWHISNLKVDLACIVDAVRIRGAATGASEVWKGLPMAKVKYITSPDELPAGQNYVLVMYVRNTRK